MHHLRSGAGVVAVTVAAVAVLSFPVMAAGKGPPEVVGGGRDTAREVVPPHAKVPDSPPGQVKHSDAAPKPEPPSQESVPDQVSPPAPQPHAPPASTPAPTRSEGTAPPHAGHDAGSGPHPRPTLHAENDAEPVSAANGNVKQAGELEHRTRTDARTKASAAGDLEPSSADTRHAGATNDGDFGGVGARETVDLPEDASPATLPFTGFQLALTVLIGLAVTAVGLTLRRSAIR